DLPLHIEAPSPPFSLQIGAEHVGHLMLPPNETLAFRIAVDSSRQLLCDFLVVNIECSPPLLIDIVCAPEGTSEEEVQGCVAAARAAMKQPAALAAPPAAAPAAAESASPCPAPVPTALAEFLGEEPTAAALRGGLRFEVAAPPSPPDTPESGRGGATAREVMESFDDRPPTPTPEGFQMPEPKILRVEQTQRNAQQGPCQSSGGQPAADLSGAVSSQVKLSPAEATRIAALRAKGMLDTPSTPSAPCAPEPAARPPPPEGYDDADRA
ncbi:unnamed protein product, partial [Effrenium voratum]